MEAEDVKRLGSAINILSTEKLKAQKVSYTMLGKTANWLTKLMLLAYMPLWNAEGLNLEMSALSTYYRYHGECNFTN